MGQLSTAQQNDLRIGTHLAAELVSSQPDLRAFVVVGAYALVNGRRTKPTRLPNVDSDLKYWLRYYEVRAIDLENDLDIDYSDLINSVYADEVPTLTQLEILLANYLDDFSHLDVAWRVANPLP